MRLATPVSPVSLCFTASGLQIRLQIGALVCAFLVLLCLLGPGGGYREESAGLRRSVALTCGWINLSSGRGGVCFAMVTSHVLVR